MYFLGHTRFSLFEPESSSWRLSRAIGASDTDKYLEELYSHERLNDRAQIFIEYALPLLEKARKGNHLVHVVSYSEELPEEYQLKLEEASRRYDWLVLDKRTAKRRKGKSLEKWALENFPTGAVYAEYRLDDDDLLAVDFFNSLGKYCNENFVGFIVSHGYGVQAFHQNGVFREPRIEHRPKIAIGLARICRINESGKVDGPKRTAHTNSDRVAPVVLDSSRIMFLHSFHLSQDSGVDKPDGDLGNRLRNYLNLPSVVDSASLASPFPGVPIGGKLDGVERARALAKAHSSVESLRGVFLKLLRRLT